MKKKKGNGAKDLFSSRSLALVVLVLAVTFRLATPRPALGMCCPLGGEGQLLATAQITFISIDPERTQVRMIPNIRFSGNARTFTLLVPTPSFPTFSEADPNIWNEAAQLTRPMVRSGRGGGFDCGSNWNVASDANDSRLEDGVEIHGVESVGAFTATIVTSENPTALVTWLNNNGFMIPATFESRFDPYIARGWYFTAMELDTTALATPLRPQWDFVVDPVEVRYAASDLEIAAPLFTLNASAEMPVMFYIVDSVRASIPGFTTSYANRISAGEQQSIARLYPALSELTEVGRVLTRLDRKFPTIPIPEASLYATRAEVDDEFIRVAAADDSGDADEGRAPKRRAFPAEVLLFAAPFVARRRSRRRP